MAKEAAKESAEKGAMPVPPWQRTGRRPKAPARAPLTQEAIVDAAMRVIDAEGYDAVSMRRVAAELNTGPASLYAHVANKDELLSLMIDRAIGETEIPPPDPERWQEQLKEALRGQRRVYQAHPGIARAVMGRVPLGPNGLRAIEGFLAIGRAGGLPDRALAWAADVIALYVTAAVFEESMQQAANPDIVSEADLEAWLDEMRKYISSLPADQFPTMTSMVDDLFEGGGPDGRFEFGLDLMIRGLASYADEAEARAEKPGRAEPAG